MQLDKKQRKYDLFFVAILLSFLSVVSIEARLLADEASESAQENPEAIEQPTEVVEPEPEIEEKTEAPEPEPVSTEQALKELLKAGKSTGIESSELMTLKRDLALIESLSDPNRPLVVGVTGLKNSGVSQAFNNITSSVATEETAKSSVGYTQGTSKSLLAFVPADTPKEKIAEIFGNEFNAIEANSKTNTSKATRYPTVYWQYWDQPFVIIDVPGINESKSFSEAYAELDKSTKYCDVFVATVPTNYLSQNYIALLKELALKKTKIVLSLSVDQITPEASKEYFSIFTEIETAAGIVSERKIIIERAGPEAGEPANIVEIKGSSWNVLWGQNATSVAILEELPKTPLALKPTDKETLRLISNLEKNVNAFLTALDALDRQTTVSEKVFDKYYDPRQSGIYKRIDRVWRNNNKSIRVLSLSVGMIYNFIKLVERINPLYRRKSEAVDAKKQTLEERTRTKSHEVEFIKLAMLVEKSFHSLIKIEANGKLTPNTETVLEKVLDKARLIEIQRKFYEHYSGEPKLDKKINKGIRLALTEMRKNNPYVYYAVVLFGDLGYKVISTAIGFAGPAAAAFSGQFILPLTALGTYARYAAFIYPVVGVGLFFGTFAAYWFGKSKVDHLVDHSKSAILSRYMKKVLLQQKNWRREWFLKWLKQQHGSLDKQSSTDRVNLKETQSKIAQLRASCRSSMSKK